MSLTVFLAVLAAAMMHAAWNAAIKVRLDRFASISLMTVGMGVSIAPAASFVPVPTGWTWAWILGSLVCHTGYRLFLIKAYETGDLAQAYPLARGTAPLLTTIGGIFLIAEYPTPLAMAGIGALCAGTLLMSFKGSGAAHVNKAAVGYALVTSVFIAGYTLTDGNGARSAATPGSYAVWLFIVDAVVTGLVALAVRGRKMAAVLASEWKLGLLTGFISGAAYWIAIWAMTLAPIGAVAALRETSILFALVISVTILGERLSQWRIVAAICIVIGMVLLRLG